MVLRKRLLLGVNLAFIFMLSLTPAVRATEYVGWTAILAELTDDYKGAEFVVDRTYAVPFSGTEWQRVVAVTMWVHAHIKYTSETVETWTDSSQTYNEIDPNNDGDADYYGTGD